MPISFGRKLENIEQGTSGSAAEVTSNNNHDATFAADGSVKLSKEGGDLNDVQSPLGTTRSEGAQGKNSGRFGAIRRWLKPWKWLKSKRDGTGRSKENRKSAEMEDVDIMPTNTAGYGTNLTGKGEPLIGKESI